MKNVNYINAGAGSGKTYTLTDTMAKLFMEGKTAPARVILTTFTELAASEFKEKSRAKLISKCLYDQASQMESAAIGTVHSLAFRYIQKYWYLLGLGANVQAMPEEQEQLFIEESLSSAASDEDVEFFNDYVEKLSIQEMNSTKLSYDMWKNDLKAMVEKSESFGIGKLEESAKYSASQLHSFLKDPDFFAGIKAKLEEKGIQIESDDTYREMVLGYQERIFRIATEWKQSFNEYKRLRNLVSFNDMERLFIDLLSKPEVREDIHESIDYIFVDEFQDSNPTQIKIFDILSELVGKGSYWVGDPKQAIYDFRGCDTELVTAITDHIEEKSKDLSSGFTYNSLEWSWRSDTNLVELANKTFVPVFNNLAPEKVKLKAKRSGDLPSDVPNIIHWNMNAVNPDTGRRLTSAKLLAQYVACRVVDILNGNHRINLVKDKNTGELRPVRPSDIAILCRVNEECDELAGWLREWNVPVTRDLTVDINNLQSMLVMTVLNYFAENKAPDILKAEISVLLRQYSNIDVLEDKETVFADNIFPVLDQLKEKMEGMPISSMVESVIHALDLYHEVEKWGDGENRKHYLSALIAAAAEYEQQCKLGGRISTLSGFINFISAGTYTVGRDVQRDGVNILTYHASKGLEWNIVILYSLGADILKDTSLQRRTYVGVNTMRKGRPDKNNFYSDFVIRYIPRFLSSRQSNLPGMMADQINAMPEYQDVRSHAYYQGARLLYVGLTRARDYLISVSAAENKLAWLDCLGIQSKFKKNTPDWTEVQVWGPASPEASYEELTVGDSIGYQRGEDEFKYLPLAEEHPEYKPLFLTPSSAEMDLTGVTAEVVDNLTGNVRMKLGDFGDKAAEMGSCIHNVFEVYRKGEDNVRSAKYLIGQYGFEEVIAPQEVIASADALFAFLEDKYGPAVEILRELPFMMNLDGQIVRGEIDLVWKTAKGCVLLDYKNYPGSVDYCNPDSEDFTGHFAPQLSIYRKALEATGEKVLDSLIYYPIQGDLVKLNY